MSEAKTEAIPREKLLILVKFLAMLGILAIAPMFPWQQITGPIVNAILFIAVMLVGVHYGIVLALVPSVIALTTGFLILPLAPMVPFIMIANCILVVTFNYFKDKNYWTGVVVASVFKFLFLYAISSLIISGPISLMMSWPQLFTALAGGVIAYGFLKFIKRI